MLTLKRSNLEEIQQSKRVDDDGGGGVGGGRRWRSGHRSRDEHGRDGEAGIGILGDGAIGCRMREHPRGDDERGRSGRVHYVPFDKEVVALCSMVCCEE